MARVIDMPRGPSLNMGNASGVTSFTEGEGVYRTLITVNSTLPAIAGGANLAVGKHLITFPPGVIRVFGSNMSMAIKQNTGNITADTPDGGLGMVIASGVVATLDGTATFENVLTGQTFNDCDGTAEVAHVATDLLIAAGDSHDLFFNVADGWAASGDTGALLTGTAGILWAKLS